MAINQICSERNLPQEVIFEAIESALVSAYKRNFGSGQNIKATIDMKTGMPHVYVERIVVDQVEDERFEVNLPEARTLEPKAEMGMLVKREVTPKSFGRIAAQTAKQVILQRIREAERDALYSSYADREGELINGMVANFSTQAVTLNLGRTEAVMPRSQQVPGERYRIGQRIRAFVMEVRRSPRGPQIIVSRTHRNMLRRLLELEVPEIFNGTVEIKSIAREAGRRSKEAVAALQDGVDPVGSCVGIRGMRIQSIVNELGGEKIDVVAWNADMSKFIGNALSPARVEYVLLGDSDKGSKTATVVVPDDQLSLAIGKEGQNARLSAKLTGWRIDIKSISEARQEELKPQEYITIPVSPRKDILAMAEAILLGKEPRPVETAEVAADVAETEPAPEPSEEVIEVEPVLEPAVPVEPEPAILATAEALLHEQELQVEAQVQEEPVQQVSEQAVAEVAAELVLEPAAEATPETELTADEEPEPELPIAEAPSLEPAPAIQKKVKSEPEKVAVTRFEYVRDERLEVLETPKKSSRRRRKLLVLDEETGELVARRQHKRDDKLDELDWEDLEY